jgi:hypothetical protein
VNPRPRKRRPCGWLHRHERAGSREPNNFQPMPCCQHEHHHTSARQAGERRCRLCTPNGGLTCAQLEESSKLWRDAWTNILNHQLASVEYFHLIYKPLGGEGSAGGSHVAVATPSATLERAAALVEAFAELKTDMMEEVKDIDRKLIVPAKLARDSLKPMKKAIKKREDAKVGLSDSHVRTLLTRRNRLTTSATRVAARPSRTKRRALIATTSPSTSMRSISNARRMPTRWPTRTSATACPS